MDFSRLWQDLGGGVRSVLKIWWFGGHCMLATQSLSLLSPLCSSLFPWEGTACSVLTDSLAFVFLRRSKITKSLRDPTWFSCDESFMSWDGCKRMSPEHQLTFDQRRYWSQCPLWAGDSGVITAVQSQNVTTVKLKCRSRLIHWKGFRAFTLFNTYCSLSSASWPSLIFFNIS